MAQYSPQAAEGTGDTSSSVSLLGALPDDLFTETLEVFQAGGEVVGQVVKLAGHMRQPELLAAARQALAAIAIVAQDRPFRRASLLHRPLEGSKTSTPSSWPSWWATWCINA